MTQSGRVSTRIETPALACRVREVYRVRMSEYSVTRSATIAAPPERIYPHIASFPAWRQWSPFEDQDPNLEREYRGAEDGEGAVYEYRGNAKAGSGIMTINRASPERRRAPRRETP